MPETKLRTPSTHNIEKAGGYFHGEHSVHSAILDEFQNRIRQGDWLPGERLPSIAQLAKEFHAGTGSIREALRALQSIGLVKIEHGSGVYVQGANPVSGLSSHFHEVGAGMNLALAETRCVIEPELAALAAQRGTDEELREIEELVRRMEKQSQEGTDFADLDVLFHRQIAQAARNPIMFQTMESVSDLFLLSRRTILLDPNASLRALRYHALIADALRTRNAAQARLLMQGHMNSMMDELMASEERKQSLKIQSQ
jgi:GntR family transcriptional regulator, transcriptional repressor for pyruvate dehydrogenase complex